MTEAATSHTTYEVSIPNPNDAAGVIASLSEQGFVTEMLEVPGSVVWLRVVVADHDCRWNDCLHRLHSSGAKLYSTDTAGPMQAEIMFCEEDEFGVGPGINALREQGCEVQLLPMTDPYSRAIWLKISAAPRLGDFFDWVQGIVEPHGGDVLEADLNRSPR